MNNFKSSLYNTSGNTWTASVELPGLGKVTTEGHGWVEARLRLWLVVEAVKLLADKPCKAPRDWTESEWRATLRTMREIMSPNRKDK